jgi:hypothetical protein
VSALSTSAADVSQPLEERHDQRPARLHGRAPIAREGGDTEPWMTAMHCRISHGQCLKSPTLRDCWQASLAIARALRQRSYSRFLTLEAARLLEALGAETRVFDQLRILGRWMRMITIPNQSSVAKAHEQFDEAGRMRPSPYYACWPM